MRSGAAIAIAALCVAALPACGRGGPAPKSGGLEVVIQSDMTIPRDLDHMTLLATQDGRTLLQVDQDLGPGALLIPAAFEIKATSSSSSVTVKAVGYKSGEARVERDALTPIPQGRDGELRFALNYLCVGTAATQANGSVVSTCPNGQTCVQGSCQTSAVPETAVPTYDPGSAPGAGGASGTLAVKIPDAGAGAGCFDVQDCFAGAVTAAVDPVSCSVALPADTDPASLNVALQFPLGGSGVCGTSACWVVFDKGTDWTLSGNTLQLPAGACSSAGARGATVVVTPSCLPKTPAQPECGAWSSIMTPAPQPTSPSPLGQSCTGAASQGCGLCGTQTRTCTNGTWSAWEACTGEGVCAVGATQTCNANGIQTCNTECQWGACGCPAGQTSCAGTCTALDSDIRNCGGCGNDCTRLPHVAGGSAACTAGRCTYACDAGYQDCGNTGQGCTTSLTTAANCGACGAVCGAGTPMCAPAAGDGGSADAGPAGSQCVSGCPALAPTLCSGSCVNLTTSSASCGTCGHGCPGGATCQAGTCVCPSGTQACGSTCSDLRIDDANCGKCGQVCPSGSTCTDSVCACNGPATQSCGKCGTQSRTCAGGTWSAWSACSGEGVCAAGTTTGCTNGTQTCSQTCVWSACQCGAGFTNCPSGCVNQQTDASNCGACGHACPAGSTCQSGKCQCPADSIGSRATTQTCGNCGSQTRTCNDGTWSAWSTCAGTGVCAPNATQACTNGTQTCSNTCQWSNCACTTGYTPCSGACVNEQTDASNCGACGHACPAGSTCQAGKCQCPADSSGTATTQACGNCGSQTRTCNDGTWSAWSACVGAGVCAPNTTQTCDMTGTQTCDSTCKWGSCVCQTGFTPCSGACVNEQTDAANCGACGSACPSGSTCQAGACVCSGASSQSCGNCGTQTRTCSKGVWSAWSACGSQGVCMAQALQLCTTSAQTTGSEVCSSSCQWSACCDPAPYAIQSTTVVMDPSTQLSWQRVGTSIVNYAQAVSACSALGTGWRVPSQTEIDQLLTVTNPAGGTNAVTVNSCAFPIPFTTSELRQNATNGFFENRFWTSNPFTPPSSWNCPTSAAQWITDLWTGDANWAGCVETAGAKVLCVK